MTHLHIYLNFNGNCREAMTFYRDCFGGQLTLQAVKDTPLAPQCPAGVQNHILHSSLTGEGFTLMGSDMLYSDAYAPGTNFSLSMNCRSEEQIRCFFEKLSQKGQVYEPLKEQFWGALFGMVADDFGIRWMLNYQKNGSQSFHQIETT